MKHWTFEKLTEEQEKNMYETMQKNAREDPEYDDIVDRSNFVQDKETVRNRRLNAGSSGARVGVYDDHEPSDIEIALRNGRLDKAEVTQLQIKKQAEALEKNEKLKKQAKEAVKEAAIENALGINGEQAKPNTKQQN